MNILLLITKGEIGGAQQSVFTLTDGLKRRGHIVSVGFDGGSFLQKKLTDANIQQHHFHTLSRTQNPFRIVLFCIEFYRYISTHQHDIIHGNSTNTLFALCIAKFVNKDIKTVFTFRGLSILDEQYKQWYIRLPYILFFKTLLNWCNAQIYVSKENLTIATSIGITKNASVVYNALPPDTTYLEPHTARSHIQQYIPQHPVTFLLGSIGRIAYQKNYTYLVDIMCIVKQIDPTIACVIIGDGPEKDNLQSYIQKKEIEGVLFLLPALPNASQYIKGLDAFILPSLYEGMSITLLETLSAGVPALVSDIPTNRETMNDASLFFPFNDPRKAAEQIILLKQSKQLQQTLKTQSITRSHIFTQEHTVTQYELIYTQL